MIDTELKFAENDLNEIIRMFDDGKDISVRHLFSEKSDRVVNTFVLGGKSYAYGNYLGVIEDEIVRKRLVKRYAKVSLYKALSSFTGKVLPWGSISGIRPTKLAYRNIEEEGEFKDFFRSTLLVSEKKTELVAKVLEGQKGYYELNDDNTDFFVFIPFCPSRCRYCSFITSDVKSAAKLTDKYVDTLIYEIENSKKFIKKLRSVYVGGGTPVALSDSQLDRILSSLDDITKGVEFTVEAGRPDRITRENLKILKAHGVNRICINPQTFNDKTLKLLGRDHTAKETIEKYLLAKNDFAINMDLIAGLEGETFEDFKYTLEQTLSLRPDNITVHTLCIKRGSYLAENTSRLSGEETEKMVDYAYDLLTEKGYLPYYLYRQKYMSGNLENVGYSLPGKQCIYNIDTMEDVTSCVACGANAISKKVIGADITERSAAPKDVKTYIEKIDTILKDKETLFN